MQSFRQGYGSAFIESGSGSSILRKSYSDPIRIQGFDDQKFTVKRAAENFLSFLGSKIAIYLSLGLHKGALPKLRRIRQPSIENIHQYCKKLNVLTIFYFLWVIFVLRNPDPDTDSGTPLNPDLQHCF